jgi:hypothetical protein
MHGSWLVVGWLAARSRNDALWLSTHSTTHDAKEKEGDGNVATAVGQEVSGKAAATSAIKCTCSARVDVYTDTRHARKHLV